MALTRKKITAMFAPPGAKPGSRDAKRDAAPGSFSPGMTKSESFSACWWIFDPSVPAKFKFIG
jgi:hypothetical protein